MSDTTKKVYEGEWKDYKANGQGVSYYTDGNKSYEGEWMDARYHGQGVSYHSDIIKERVSFIPTAPKVPKAPKALIRAGRGPDYDPVEWGFVFKRKWIQWKAHSIGAKAAKKAWRDSSLEDEWKKLYKGSLCPHDAWDRKMEYDSNAAGM